MRKTLQTLIEKKLSAVTMVLLVIQPFMDVLSYFLSEMGSNTISTLLRFGMLAVVGLLGFLVTDKKRAYFCIYGVMALYWALHVLNCFRVGYISLYQDTANYFRILTFPVFLLTFLTFFRKSGEEMRRILGIGFAVNIGLSLVFTALPWGLAALGVGEPVYTYDKLFVGVMGWFAIPNAQSCIIILLTPLTLFLAFRTRKIWFFLLACLGCFGLMFVTGTKLTFYSIFLIPLAFIFVFLLNPGRKQALPYMAVLLAIVVLGAAFRSYSPMQIREQMTDYSQGIYSDRVAKSLEQSGTSEEAMESIREGTVEDEGQDSRSLARLLAEVRRGLLGVYTDPDIYGVILEDLNDRFGIYNVMGAYHYSADSGALSDLRLRKTNYAKLVWEECDFPTRLLGFEYSKMLHNNSVYDLENDFPAVYYNCGWLGFGLYALLLVYVAWEVLSAFFRDPFQFLTVEMGAVGITFVLALGSAQISGYVLRRPNVAIYLAVTSAYLCYLAKQYRENRPQLPWWQKGFRHKKKQAEKQAE